MFQQGELYIIKDADGSFLAKYESSDGDFVQFIDAIHIDEGKYTHFLKTGALISKDLKGAFAFKTDFWVRSNYIRRIIKIRLEQNNLKVVKESE